MLDIPNMATNPSLGPASAMYEALMAVKPDSLSLSEWARRAGVNRSIFNGIRAHGNPTMGTLDRLLRAIDVSPDRFNAMLAPVRTEVAAAGLGDPRRAKYGDLPLPPLPLLGSAVAGEYGDLDEAGVDMIELQMGEVLDHLARPTSMARDRDAYALTVLSDSMSPRFEPGERIAVSPRAPVAIGDDVVVQLRGRDGEEERIKMVLVKRLVRRSPTYVELRQFNPDTIFRVPAERIRRIHKVSGMIF